MAGRQQWQQEEGEQARSSRQQLLHNVLDLALGPWEGGGRGSSDRRERKQQLATRYPGPQGRQTKPQRKDSPWLTTSIRLLTALVMLMAAAPTAPDCGQIPTDDLPTTNHQPTTARNDYHSRPR